MAVAAAATHAVLLIVSSSLWIHDTSSCPPPFEGPVLVGCCGVAPRHHGLLSVLGVLRALELLQQAHRLLAARELLLRGNCVRQLLAGLRAPPRLRVRDAEVEVIRRVVFL